MKAIIKLTGIIALAAFAAGTVKGSVNDTADTSKSIAVSKGGKIVVDVPGAIKINTWLRDEVKVNVSGLDEDEPEKIDISSKGNVVTVQCRNAWSNESDAEFSIQIPVKFNADLKTSAGNIEVESPIEGNVEASTRGGDLLFRDIDGSLTAESSGGNISVEGNVKGALGVSTMGGDISIGEIKGKSAKVNTMGGNISIKKSVSGITVKTYGGDISVGDAGGDSDFLTFGGNISVGKVNGNVNMETYGGNLELSGATGAVKGRTNGGNIDLGEVNGSVDVKTIAGEISVSLIPDKNSESRIYTNMGSIILALPADAKADVEARVHVQGWWKNAKETYHISSDFSAESSSADDGKHDLVSKYKINGGGSKIFLRSVNDTITIKKQ